jgi:O-acetyl-ADP-ribose deacetylase (regulator of RNase III)
MPVSITLCDRSAEMARAWRTAFPEQVGVTIMNQNIMTVPTDALVVPANSFGFTDGGIDVVVSGAIFDMGLQEKLRPRIQGEYGGELVIGQALVMATERHRIPYIVVAPTMRVPEDISTTVNAYLAMRAALLAVEGHNARTANPAARISSIVIPGLGTGVGKMPPSRSAYQMWRAYRTIILSDTEWTQTLEKQTAGHKKMREYI